MSSISTTGRPGPRTVDEAPPTRHVAPRWGLSGVVAALQAFVLSITIVVLPAVAAFLASSPGASEGTGWGLSVTVAAGLWLLGHGVPLVAGGATVTLVPLGLTALAAFLCFASARRSAHTATAAWLAGTATYGVATFLVALLAGTTTTWGLVLSPVCGALVAAVGLGCGILARADAPRLGEVVRAGRGRQWTDRVPVAARVGVRGGLLGLACTVGTAGLVVVVWIVAGRATSGDILVGLAPGLVGGLILAVAQVALVPNLVVWAVSWIAGPGFSVGEGSTFTVAGTASGPLPAVPLLGALPRDGWAGALAVLAPLLVVGFGVLVGLFLWRRLPVSGDGRPGWRDIGVAAGAVALVVAGVIGAVVGLASGAVGVGRMSEVGASGLLTAVVLAAEIGGGAVATLAWCRTEVHRIVAGEVRRLRERVGRQGA